MLFLKMKSQNVNVAVLLNLVGDDPGYCVYKLPFFVLLDIVFFGESLPERFVKLAGKVRQKLLLQ